MNNGFYGVFFRAVRAAARLFMRRFTLINPENITKGAVYIGRHQNEYGPNMLMLCFPEPVHLWALYPFTERRACYRHYLDFTLTKRLGWNRLFAAVCARLLSWTQPALLRSAGAIPVYRDARAVKTIRRTVDVLTRNESVLLFADRDYSQDAGEVCDIYTGFSRIEKYYHKATGKHLPFIPLNPNKRAGTIEVGKPIYYRDGEDFERETMRIASLLKSELTRMTK